MALQVEVNVMVDDVKWSSKDGWYTGKFIFQQIKPLSPVVVDKHGNVNLKKAGVTDGIELTYNWASNAVEIDGELYPADIADPPSKSFWITSNGQYPAPGDNDGGTGGEITVENGTGKKKLKMKDLNSPDKHFTYCLAMEVAIDCGAWLVADPKIINKGTNRLYSYQSEEQGE